MAAFLTDAWLEDLEEASADLPSSPGIGGTVRFVVTSTPIGRVEFRIIVGDGRVVGVVPGKEGDADATVTWKYPEAVAWATGELDPDVAYMTGRCKVEGDYASYLFGLRPVLGGAAWAGLLADLAERTGFEAPA